MQDVVILSGIRTPIGAFAGALSSFTAPQLGSMAIKAAIEKAGITNEDVEEVLFGHVLQGGVGQAPARQAAIGAGLPVSVPCTTINKVCGSGMKAVMMAAQAIKAGDAQCIVAGGMESMSNAPYFSPNARTGLRMGDAKLIDMMIHDGLWDPYNNMHMGSCGDLCARELGYTREQIDAFAVESYHRAQAAQKECRFSEEIVPVTVPQRKGDPIVVSADEGPSKGGDPEKTASLKPAFDKEGVTTAGNASSINDGGAALVVTSAEFASSKGLKPLAKVVAYAQHAQKPEWFTTAPAGAIEKLLAKTGLSVADVDLFEINEAFAVVAMNVKDKVGIPHEKVNVNGGAVALGHPIGMTGARLVLTAMHELRRRGGKYAISTPCIGGGEATAVLIEAL
ncbi:MAG: acetyl-CoA C-acetyltransferase [Armatimonadetes bacterium]|nr:acetyl-CoA C-acetyltransferase [Armatimonadota bacterium]